MHTRDPQLFAVAVAAVALASCSGNGTLQGTPLTNPANLAQRGHAQSKRSWIKPSAISQKLLYIGDDGTDTVQIYTYPGLTYAGELTGFQRPEGACADRAGNVWITDSLGADVLEFAHGGTTPINQLSISGPQGCAINRKTGDLAVTMGFSGQLAVYHNGAGSPTFYIDSNFYYASFVGYDPSGNLFMDGVDSSNNFRYAELPANDSQFTDITLSQTPDFPGAVQWDGQYVAVGNESGVIFQTQGSTIVNTIILQDTTGVGAFYILPGGKKVVAPSSSNVDGIFAYPAGGSALKSISGGLTEPFSAVLSI